MRLKEDTSMPLYQQLMEAIKTDIEQGIYQVGDCIPSEPKLQDTYQVSRITIRRAISELVEEGYLVKKQGKGTFVNHHKLSRKMHHSKAIQSFSDSCIECGRVPKAKVIKQTVEKATSEQAFFFQIPEQSPIIHIQRVRYADDEAIMLENNDIPKALLPELETLALENQSLFSLLKTNYQCEVSKTYDCTLEITRATNEQANLLQISVGDPLFLMKVYFLNQDDQPIMIGNQYIVGSRYLFHI